MLLVLHHFSRNIALGTERDGCDHLVLNLTLVSGEHVDIGWLSQNKERPSAMYPNVHSLQVQVRVLVPSGPSEG